MNLHCPVDYGVSMPQVMLIRKDGKLATHYANFVDDIHSSGRDQKGDNKHTKCACKQLKSRMNSSGKCADDGKYHEPSPTPGA